MGIYEDSRKQKRWNDLKVAVGTMATQNNTGSSRLTLDNILLNIKAADFASLVCQSQIQTPEDIVNYTNRGYDISLTAEELKTKFNLNPNCVWYSPCFSNRCIYFNPDTLAAVPNLDMLISGMYPNAESFYSVIQGREAEVAAGEYLGSIMCLPDAMQMEYFNLLVERKGAAIPGLYHLFFTTYINSDYGFSVIDPKTMDAILHAKTEEDRKKTAKALHSLPDAITVFRGGNSASMPYENAFSWTLDRNVANFFACRRGTGEGYLVEAQVSKEDIIDIFLDDRCENEVVITPGKAQVVQKTPIRGADYIGSVLPQIGPMFQEYKELLKQLPFAQDSAEHGVDHEARVLLLCLIIAEEMHLPLRDRRILATAAIYHDTQRINDIDDLEHGKAAAEFYHKTAANPDPLVEFLCNYHSRPDNEGYEAIMKDRKLGKSRSRSKLFLDVFKDADGLERVRFGIQCLDLNQLRLPVSQQLTLVARLCSEQVKGLSTGDKSKASLDGKIKSAASKAHTSSQCIQQGEHLR